MRFAALTFMLSTFAQKPNGKLPQLTHYKCIIVQNLLWFDFTYLCIFQFILCSKTLSTGRPPIVIRSMRDTIVPEGERVILDCLVLRPHECNIYWYKEQQLIDFHEHTRFTAEVFKENVVRLIIRNAHIDDIGYYTVVVKNKFGSSRTSAQLLVEVPSYQSDNDTNVQVRRKRRSSSAVPPATDAYGLQLVAPSTAVAAAKDNELIQLRWRRAPKETHTTTYTVEVRTIETEWVRLVRGVMSNQYSFQLPKATGRNLQYEFRVRREQLQAAPHADEDDIQGTAPSLAVKYTSIPVERIIPKAYIAWKLDKVLSSASMATQMVTYFKADGYVVEPFERPEFAKPPEIITKQKFPLVVREGDQCNVEFWVHGYPTPMLEITFRGITLSAEHPVVENMRCRINESGRCLLTVDRMRLQDTGEYVVRVVNGSGYAVLPMHIEVAEPPVFVDSPIDATVAAGDTIHLASRIVGYPAPDVRWLKDWQPLTDTKRIRIARDETSGRYTLTINDAIKRDAGLYTCEAKNLAGTALCTVNVTVGPAHAPGMLKAYTSTPVRIVPHQRPLLDFYDVYEEIGRGSDAVVRKVEEKVTSLEHAAKITFWRPDQQNNDEITHREIAILNQIEDNSHIVHMHDAFAGHHVTVIVQELLRGGTLLDRFSKRTHLTEWDVREVVRQILQGVRHLHDKNIIKIDLKLEDIMCREADGEAGETGVPNIKLIDFAVSEQLAAPDATVKSEYGAVEFASPEQVS